MLIDIELKEEHLKPPATEHPVSVSLIEADFPRLEISQDRITTNENSHRSIAPNLAAWPAQFRQCEPVREGVLHLDPVAAGISITDGGQSCAGSIGNSTRPWRPPSNGPAGRPPARSTGTETSMTRMVRR